MKAGTTDLLKFRKLKRRLKISTWQAVGLLEMLWHVTAKNCPRGDIGKMTDEDIALMIEWDDDPHTLIEPLVELGWIDRDPEFRLVVHDWQEHAPNYVKGNLAKSGISFCDEEISKRNLPAAVPNEECNQASKPPKAGAEDIPRDHPKDIPKDRPKEHPKDHPKDRPQDGPTKPNQAKPIQFKPPPPNPPANGQAPPGDETEWAAAAFELIERGVEHPGPAIKSARKAGARPGDLQAILQHFDAHPDAWGPAALQKRITEFLRGQSPDSGWPRPSPKHSQAEAAARKAQREAEDKQRQERERQAQWLANQAREQQFGPTYDSWSDDQLREFLFANEVLRRQLRKRGRGDPGVRASVLCMLEKQSRQAETA